MKFVILLAFLMGLVLVTEGDKQQVKDNHWVMLRRGSLARSDKVWGRGLDGHGLKGLHGPVIGHKGRWARSVEDDAEEEDDDLDLEESKKKAHKGKKRHGRSLEDEEDLELAESKKKAHKKRLGRSIEEDEEDLDLAESKKKAHKGNKRHGRSIEEDLEEAESKKKAHKGKKRHGRSLEDDEEDMELVESKKKAHKGAKRHGRSLQDDEEDLEEAESKKKAHKGKKRHGRSLEDDLEEAESRVKVQQPTGRQWSNQWDARWGKSSWGIDNNKKGGRVTLSRSGKW